jgi:hypothetical protein
MSGVAAYSTTAIGAPVIAQAQQIMTQVNTGMGGTLSPADKQQLASQIGALVGPTAGSVRSLFEALWTGVSLSAQVASRIRDEVAVLVALEGRNGVALQVDLLRLLGRGVADADAVSRALWPAHSQYRVALTLSGTRALAGLDQLLPGARQWPLVGPALPAGIPYSDIRGLVDPVVARRGSSMLITLPVSASDPYAAIALARRRMAETLDQYAAGQRLLDLAIDPQSVALSSISAPTMHDPRVGGSMIARPLTSHWPTPLRPALRMANLAARMEAPVASVMLAWSAIESLGVSHNDFELIAKACALHSLRQQILSVYKSVTDSANARLRFSRWRVSEQQAALGKLERGQVRAARGISAAAQDAVARLHTSVALARALLTQAESYCTQLEHNLLPNIEIIRRNLLHGGDRGHPLNLSSWRLRLNDFLDAIQKLDATSPADLWQTQNAIAVLANEAGGLADEQLATWQRLLADPPMLADWLQHQQETFHGLMAWMYASRNSAIHSGQFSVPADVLTAQAGKGIVDMILEFLGYWYQDQYGQGAPESDAMAILRTLADRKDTLDRHLRSAGSCHPLNVETVTASDTDCWNRV